LRVDWIQNVGGVEQLGPMMKASNIHFEMAEVAGH